MNLTDEEITRAFFEMILRKKEFTEDEEENFAYLWEESLNAEFNVLSFFCAKGKY